MVSSWTMSSDWPSSLEPKPKMLEKKGIWDVMPSSTEGEGVRSCCWTCIAEGIERSLGDLRSNSGDEGRGTSSGLRFLKKPKTIVVVVKMKKEMI